MITVPQFVMLTGLGAMKSYSCEVKESDARLFTKALPNDSHVPGSKMKSRSSCISPKVFAESAPSSDSPAGIAVWLIVPTDVVPVRSVAGPHADPVHSRTLIV